MFKEIGTKMDDALAFVTTGGKKIAARAAATIGGGMFLVGGKLVASSMMLQVDTVDKAVKKMAEIEMEVIPAAK